MFAMLRRPPLKRPAHELVDALRLRNPSTAITPSVPIGVSMKFQYGRGDTPLEGYQIKRGVGSGGFGEVYFAESDSGKEVALKRIQKNLDVEVRGVRHCLNLRHPNLVSIYDIKFDKLEQGWIVMEFIDGDSLRDRMNRFPQGMTAAETIQWFAPLAAGVAYLHDQGIVHRDLKPANVFLDGGLVKIGDYGLSKYISASRRGGQTESVGTFHYMAPEIGRGEYGKEIDIYSLGIILHELLTGNVPFDGESSQEIILKHLTADPDLSQVPEPFAAVIQKALAKNPASRFRDCRDMLGALGWELDAGGLAVKRPEGASLDLPPVLKPFPAADRKEIPVSKPSGSFKATIAGGNKPRPSSPGRYGFGKAGEVPRENLYREPVARAVQQVVVEAQTYYRELPPGVREIAIVVLVLMLLSSAGIIAPLLFALFGCYACYYVVWYAMGGANAPPHLSSPPFSSMKVRPQPMGSPQIQPATVPFQNEMPVAAKLAPKPTPVPYKVALRNWQSQQRSKLNQRSFLARSHEITRSWAFSGVVTSVIALIAAFLTVARNVGDTNALLSGIAWTAIMSLSMTWTILYLTKMWESRSEDSIVQRFIQLSAGLALGVASFSISEFLMVPWAEIASNHKFVTLNGGIDWNKTWQGFYGENSMPLLAGHIAYFGSLMWIVRWWRQSDILRKSRFSAWALAWSVAMAGLVQGLFFFPVPWCFALAGLTSITLQMASPWIDPLTGE